MLTACDISKNYTPSLNDFSISVERLLCRTPLWWLLLGFTQQWILSFKILALVFPFLLNVSLWVGSDQFNHNHTYVYLYFRKETNKRLDRSSQSAVTHRLMSLPFNDWSLIYLHFTISSIHVSRSLESKNWLPPIGKIGKS